MLVKIAQNRRRQGQNFIAFANAVAKARAVRQPDVGGLKAAKTASGDEYRRRRAACRQTRRKHPECAPDPRGQRSSIAAYVTAADRRAGQLKATPGLARDIAVRGGHERRTTRPAALPTDFIAGKISWRRRREGQGQAGRIGEIIGGKIARSSTAATLYGQHVLSGDPVVEAAVKAAGADVISRHGGGQGIESGRTAPPKWQAIRGLIAGASVAVRSPFLALAGTAGFFATSA